MEERKFTYMLFSAKIFLKATILYCYLNINSFFFDDQCNSMVTQITKLGNRSPPV